MPPATPLLFPLPPPPPTVLTKTSRVLIAYSLHARLVPRYDRIARSGFDQVAYARKARVLLSFFRARVYFGGVGVGRVPVRERGEESRYGISNGGEDGCVRVAMIQQRIRRHDVLQVIVVLYSVGGGGFVEDPTVRAAIARPHVELLTSFAYVH